MTKYHQPAATTAAAEIPPAIQMSPQLPLSIGLRPGATFSGFIAGPNAEAVTSLRDRIGEWRSLYLWGDRGTGKSHLLQAACHASATRGAAAVYLPLALNHEYTPDILDGLESLALICIDDLQAIAGLDEWERGLFHLYNQARERGGTIVLAGDRAARSLGLGLLDLVTRLGWDLVFQLHPLDDQGLGEALRLRAEALGLELPEEVVVWLLRRCARDTTVLFALLERLDHASLSAQRRLTIPFVRELVGTPDA
jgi:DnaA-homolog protein